MVASHTWMRELGAFLLSASIILILLLLVAVPAHSQDLSVPTSGAVELIEDQAPHASFATIVYFALQVVVLCAVMISYMVFSSKQRAVPKLSDHHWWSYLRFHT